MKKTLQDARPPSTTLRPSSPAPPSEPPAADDDALLTKASRLLRHIRDAQLLRVAREHGYTQTEHEAGCGLYRRASGERTAAYREVAAFEELWFARTRAILRRVVPLGRRDAFEASFFEGLSHDGDARRLTASVRGYLDRFSALQGSSAPGARTLWTMLCARGLHDVFVASTRARLDLLDGLVPSPASPSPAPDVDQAIALASLGAWYDTWSVALRGAFTAPQRDRLGLRTA